MKSSRWWAVALGVFAAWAAPIAPPSSADESSDHARRIFKDALVIDTLFSAVCPLQ